MVGLEQVKGDGAGDGDGDGDGDWDGGWEVGSGSGRCAASIWQLRSYHEPM